MIIVDGYNVIHKWKTLVKFKNNMELARSRLIEILANYQGYIGQEVIVVFDSSLEDKPNQGTVPPNIQVVFAPRGQSADTFIERFVYSHSSPSSITVVTEDRLFRMTVSHKGVYILTPEMFEEEVGKKTRDNPHIFPE